MTCRKNSFQQLSSAPGLFTVWNYQEKGHKAPFWYFQLTSAPNRFGWSALASSQPWWRKLLITHQGIQGPSVKEVNLYSGRHTKNDTTTQSFKGTVIQIEKALITYGLGVYKVSWKFRIPTIYNFAVIFYLWNLLLC